MISKRFCAPNGVLQVLTPSTPILGPCRSTAIIDKKVEFRCNLSSIIAGVPQRDLAQKEIVQREPLSLDCRVSFGTLDEGKVFVQFILILIVKVGQGTICEHERYSIRRALVLIALRSLVLRPEILDVMKCLKYRSIETFFAIEIDKHAHNRKAAGMVFSTTKSPKFDNTCTISLHIRLL